MLSCEKVFSQNDSAKKESFISPYNPRGDYNTLGIKAKALPWLFGNAMGGNYFLGFEYGFCKNHSVAIDLSFTGSEGDSDPDSAGNILSSYSNEKTIYLNYRYYLNFQHLREKGVVLYTGLLGRYGKRWDFSDPGRSMPNILSEINEYRSAGLFAGTLIRFKKEKRLGLDVNIRFYYNKDMRAQKILAGGQLDHFSGVFSTYNMGLGLNLYWCFYRKKK